MYVCCSQANLSPFNNIVIIKIGFCANCLQGYTRLVEFLSRFMSFFFVRSYPVMSEDFVVSFFDNVFAFSQV